MSRCLLIEAMVMISCTVLSSVGMTMSRKVAWAGYGWGWAWTDARPLPTDEPLASAISLSPPGRSCSVAFCPSGTGSVLGLKTSNTAEPVNGNSQRNEKELKPWNGSIGCRRAEITQKERQLLDLLAAQMGRLSVLVGGIELREDLHQRLGSAVVEIRLRSGKP